MDSNNRMIDFALLGDRLFILYDDLTFFEVSIKSKEIKQELNLVEIGDSEEIEGEKATAFKVFEDLEMFAVATKSHLVLFDYSTETLNLFALKEIANVIKITFFDCHVVLCIEEEECSDDVTLKCFELEGFIEGEESVGQITVKRFMQ